MSRSEIPIVPAIIPKSAAEVVSFVSQLSFVREVHIDVVDGEFVAAVSWPVNPNGSPMEVKAHTDKFTLEVDLMMSKPFTAAREWEKAGADMIIFHVETIDIDSFVDFCKHSAASVGIAFHGETALDTITPYLPYADYVQVMGIDTIGAQGQPFSTRTLEKVETIKAQYPHIPVSVDGSVNKETITKIVKAGADRVIVGSAISHAADMSVAYDELRSHVNGN
jgi:ribulose-phosphate 3-epimerase